MNRRISSFVTSSALIVAVVACTVVVVVYAVRADTSDRRVPSNAVAGATGPVFVAQPTEPYQLVRLAASRIARHDYLGFRALFDPHENLSPADEDTLQRTLQWPFHVTASVQPVAQYVRPRDVSAWRDPETGEVGYSLRLISLYGTDAPTAYDSKALAIKQIKGSWFVTADFGEAPYAYVSLNGDSRQLFDPVPSVPGLDAFKEELAADVHTAPEAINREVAAAVAEHGRLDDAAIEWLHGTASDQERLALRTASVALRANYGADNGPIQRGADSVVFPIGGGSGMVAVERRADGRWYLARISLAAARPKANPNTQTGQAGAGALVTQWNAARVAGSLAKQRAALSASGRRRLQDTPELAAGHRDARVVRAVTAWVQTNGNTAHASVQELLATPKNAHRWLVLTLHFNGTSWRIDDVSLYQWTTAPAQ